MLKAPLEQFEILQLTKINIFFFDFSITNFLIINLLSILTFMCLIYFNGVYNKSSLFYSANS